MKVPGRPRQTPSTPAALPDQPYLLMAAAHMNAQGTLLNNTPPSAAMTPPTGAPLVTA